MLSDEQIAALTPQERHELVVRLQRPVDELWHHHVRLQVARRRRLYAMVVGTALMVPWIVYLAATLPQHYVAHRWRATWVGFDVLLVAMLAATITLALMKRPMVCMIAFATGVLLLCDAWFDCMTAANSDITGSALTALLVEIPVGLVLIGTALTLLRLLLQGYYVLGEGESIWSLRASFADGRD